MIKEINECVGCPQGCINCGRKSLVIRVCDWCENPIDDYYYDIENEEVCKECAIEYIRDNASDYLDYFDKHSAAY